MIDWIYILIIFMALALFYIERKCNAKNKGVEKFIGCEPKVETISKLTSGYSKFGEVPLQPRCNITLLGENCSNIPDNSDNIGNNQSVCQKSIFTYPIGTKNLKVPLYVMGRSTSRVRQCRNIYNP